MTSNYWRIPTNMSYAKKDEDGDQTMVKLDRTSVFQDGKSTKSPHGPTDCLLLLSTSIQQLSHISTKMPNPAYQNHFTPLHWRKIPDQRSDFPLFRHLQAISKQRCLVTADGIPCHQGTCNCGGGCYHGYEQYHERYRGR